MLFCIKQRVNSCLRKENTKLRPMLLVIKILNTKGSIKQKIKQAR